MFFNITVSKRSLYLKIKINSCGISRDTWNSSRYFKILISLFHNFRNTSLTHFRFSQRWRWRIKSSGMLPQNKNVWSRRWRHYDPSEYRRVSTSRHVAASQMTRICMLRMFPSKSFHYHHSVITRRYRICMESVYTCTKSQSFVRHRR